MKNVWNVWIITWHYDDNSAFGIVKVYARKETAEEDLQMLREHGGKTFDLTEVLFNQR